MIKFQQKSGTNSLCYVPEILFQNFTEQLSNECQIVCHYLSKEGGSHMKCRLYFHGWVHRQYLVRVVLNGSDWSLNMLGQQNVYTNYLHRQAKSLENF